jgi:hypothetical protein
MTLTPEYFRMLKDNCVAFEWAGYWPRLAISIAGSWITYSAQWKNLVGRERLFYIDSQSNHNPL